MKISKTNNFNSLNIFLEKRMLKIFLLGCISGFPWVLIGSSLSLWLKEDGLSRSTIGWAGLIFAVYAVNYFWAPLIDKLKIPLLTKAIGHRKSWIFLMQSLIGISLLIWSSINPSENLYLVILIGLFIAFFSATQDITIDALRIEQFKINEKEVIAAGASMSVIGWWTGFKLGGFLSLYLSDLFYNLNIENNWQVTFYVCLLYNFFKSFFTNYKRKLYSSFTKNYSFQLKNFQF